MRLIRVFATLPADIGARIVIAGDGPEMGKLKAAAASAGVASRTIFAGHVKDPSRILGRFDVFATSSDTEQMPNAVLEAMAAGLALSATDVGDIKRMLCAANAPFVVPANDEDAFAASVLRLLRERPLASRIGRANRDRAQTEFGIDRMVTRYDELYSEN
jgi:glycosyltransferase involved in cell wall biosynthesis